jgi:hypothetical protein
MCAHHDQCNQDGDVSGRARAGHVRGAPLRLKSSPPKHSFRPRPEMDCGSRPTVVSFDEPRKREEDRPVGEEAAVNRAERPRRSLP